MIWLVALLNGTLAWLLFSTGPEPKPAAPWRVADDPPPTRWERFRHTQQTLIEAAGLQWGLSTFLLLRLAAVSVLALGMGLLLGPVSFVCGGLAGWLAVQEWLRSRQEGRLLRFADHFREVLQSIANSLKANRALPQALDQARRDLLRVPGREQDLMAVELSRLMEELHLGASLDSALRGLVVRVPLEEVRLFADAVTLCRVRGGNLVQVLQTLARLNVDRFQVRQEVRVQTAQKRLEGAIISVMPMIMLVLLSMVAPDYMAPLTGTGLGQAAIGGGLLLVLIAFLITRSITRIEV